MSRTARIAAAAALAGLMLTAAVIAATGTKHEPGADQVQPRPSGDPLAAELARCSRLTMPDASCEAVWNAHRRRFLGEAVIEIVPDPGSLAGSPHSEAIEAVPTPSASY
jgi:conjugative transfer region protein TrbK